MGERAGNTRLAEVVAALHDHTDYRTGVDESRLSSISKLVATFTGKDVAANAPIVGARRLHADRGHPRRRRREGRSLRDPPRARPLRPAAPLRARQALGQGVARPEPEEARHRAAGRGRAISCCGGIVELGDKKHTVVAEDLPLHHRRRAEDARRAARARRELPRRRSATGEPPDGRGDARLQAASARRRDGDRRRRLRRVHERAAQGGQARSRLEVPRAHRLPRAHPAGRPHHRAGRDGDHVARRASAPQRHVHDARRRLRPARRRRDRDREDAERARGRRARRREEVRARAAPRRGRRCTDERVRDFGPRSSRERCRCRPPRLLSIDRRRGPDAAASGCQTCSARQSALPPDRVRARDHRGARRHVPDDTYRFEPARDFTDRNVYRSILLRLENLEHAARRRAARRPPRRRDRVREGRARSSGCAPTTSPPSTTARARASRMSCARRPSRVPTSSSASTRR